MCRSFGWCVCLITHISSQYSASSVSLILLYHSLPPSRGHDDAGCSPDSLRTILFCNGTWPLAKSNRPPPVSREAPALPLQARGSEALHIGKLRLYLHANRLFSICGSCRAESLPDTTCIRLEETRPSWLAPSPHSTPWLKSIAEEIRKYHRCTFRYRQFSLPSLLDHPSLFLKEER